MDFSTVTSGLPLAEYSLKYSTLDKNMNFHLRDDAPEIAKESYKEYQRYYSKEMEEKRAEFFRKVEEEVDYGDDD